MGRVAWIIQVDSMYNNHKRRYKRGRNDRVREGDVTVEAERERCDDRSRGQSDVTTSHIMWAASRSWKRQGMSSPLEPPEEPQLC